ncbi:MAG: hypothetical protein PHE25_03745, partial [Candidatus Gracilibacteria bacterium]|nr:hypothetical protein [Candidatus Gracilibacteria bacterium]
PIQSITSTGIDLLTTNSGTVYKLLLSSGSLTASGNIIYQSLNSIILNLITINCPNGFIAVSGNSTFSTTDFCVAKYDMTYSNLSTNPSNGGWNTYPYTTSTNIASQPGYPIASLNQTQAINACQSLGAGYHLITNNERMTIARNIEIIGSNWSGGAVGNGKIYNGISNDLTAGCDGNPDGEWGVPSTNLSCSRRILTLSNGNQIWDFAGNVWEHVNKANTIDGSNNSLGQTIVAGCSTPTGWSEWSSCSDKTNSSINGSYNSNQGIGQIYYSQGVGSNILLRGANAGVGDGVYAGVFALYLLWVATSSTVGVGFRCAYIN